MLPACIQPTPSASINGSRFTLSLGKRLAAGVPRSQPLVLALHRAAIPFILGMAVYAFPHFNPSTQRILGVLQRIAICYLAASAIYLWCGATDGYQAGSLTVSLAPIAAVFTNGNPMQSLYTNSVAQNIGVTIGPLNSNLTLAGSYQMPRPGVEFTVGIRSSDTAVVAPSMTSLRFTDGNQQSIQVRPVGAGTAILSLDQLPNGVAPAAGGQIVFSVTEPDLSVPSVTLGYNLQAPLQVKLADRLPLPATDVAVTVSTDYPFFVALSNDSATAGSTSNQSIQVVIPAGQRLSSPFYAQVVGQASSSGLRVTAGSYTPSTSTFAVTSTVFVFREAAQTQPINIAAGSAATLTPAPLPQGAVLPAGTTIRAGVAPIPIAVTSSVPGVVSVNPATVTFRPGDTEATVSAQGITAGKAVLTVSGPVSYQYSSAQSKLDVQVK